MSLQKIKINKDASMNVCVSQDKEITLFFFGTFFRYIFRYISVYLLQDNDNQFYYNDFIFPSI